MLKNSLLFVGASHVSAEFSGKMFFVLRVLLSVLIFLRTFAHDASLSSSFRFCFVGATSVEDTTSLEDTTSGLESEAWIKGSLRKL